MIEQIKQIFSDQNELLSLPQTLAEVLRVVRDENATAQDLSDVLMHDPALTAKVLRIVNSPYYGARREVSSVSQAVMTIGTRQITALALSSSIYNLASKWNSSIDQVRFWRHSLETAIGCRMIANKLKYTNVEEAFVAGLLHDLGVMILEKTYPEQFVRIRQNTKNGESLIDLEEEAWGTNHAKVGQFLLEQWNLPSSICTAVGHHHDLFAPETTNPDLKLSQIVCLSNMISQFPVSDKPRTILSADVENREIIQSNIAINSLALQEIQKELFKTTVQEAKFLEMEIGTPEELLEEANQMLFTQYLTVENLLLENRKLRKQFTQTQVQEVAQKSLGNFAVELNKYINNAMEAMHARTSMIQDAINESHLGTTDNSLSEAVQSITDSVGTIGEVLKDLTNLSSLDTSVYKDGSSIIDLEERIKYRLEKLDTLDLPVAR